MEAKEKHEIGDQRRSPNHCVEKLQPPNLLHQIFERQARSTPGALAVEFVEADERLTYQELDRCSSWLAAHLQEKGVGSNVIVGVYLPRGIEQYVAILAILKAGGAYLPIDPSFPEERIRFTLEDAQAHLILTSELLSSEAISAQSTPLFFEQLPWREAAKISHLPLHVAQYLTKEDLCYIIYTSGTTGHPKGVCISHLNATTYVNALMEVYGVQSSDRILQGFSLAFDASVEEIWMAFSSGATLVVGTLEVMQAIDELPSTLREFGISVFSTVPTLLSAFENDELPNLKLLIFGGETAREDIIEKWAAPGRRLLNGYGPTECTVVTTYAWCKPGEPLTIGKPLPNYEIVILDEGLEEAPGGQEGELCVTGPGVSIHGYLRRPELNKKKFLERDGKRFYRTGDLVSRNNEGNIVFRGRIDTQVKIRGYRVELEEIESLLVRHLRGEDVIVQVHIQEDGAPQLVAYLLQNDPKEVEIPALIRALREDLPEYMLPTHFASLNPADVPRQSSGKIDRRALPPLTECRLLGHVTPQTDHGIVEAELATATPLERKIRNIWTEVLRKPIGLNDSFFDFGGNSLAAAQVISQCRTDPVLDLLTIRDLYLCENVRAFTQRVEERQQERASTESKKRQSKTNKKPENAPEPARVSPLEFRLVTSLQILFILFVTSTGGYLIFGGVYALYNVLYYGYLWLLNLPDVIGIGLWLVFFGIVLLPLFVLVLLPLSILSLFAFGLFWKWLLIGRYEVSDIPVWSWGYLRWWIANFFLGPIYGFTGAFVGGPFVGLFYRLLGAKIGKRVYLGTALSETDLVTIEDGASIAKGAHLRTHAIEDGVLKLRRIHIGKNVFVGSQSIISGDVYMGDNSKLHPLSCLHEGFRAPEGTEWMGSPAVEVKPESSALSRLLLRHETEARPGDFWDSLGAGLKILFLQWLYIFGYSIIIATPYGFNIILLFCLELWFGALHTLNLWILLPASLAFATMRFFSLAASLLFAKHVLTGRARAGTIPINSHEYVRRWMCGLIMSTLVDPRGTRGLTETLLMPVVCRWMGMKVGKFTEISDAEGFQPDLVSIGEGSMLADRCILGVPVVHCGRMTLGNIHIGDRTFIANVAHVPITTPIVKDGCLIGVLSIAPDEMASGSDWLGSPPLRLPNRTVSKADPSRTFSPPTRLIIARAFFNFWKMVLPGTVTEMVFWIALKIGVTAFLTMTITGFLLFLPALILGSNIVIISLPALFKWVLVGRYRSGEKPLWCNWMWRIEIVYEIELFVMSSYSALLDGTPLLPMWYRMMGARIGRRVCMLGGSVMEADLVNIGDDVNVEGFLQTHLFEDRVMKLGEIKIEEGCTVRKEGCVLYDSRMGAYSLLDDLSLIMKHETFSKQRKYRGLPAENIH